MKKFSGKKVVVSGGTRGIGLKIAKRFIDEGALVAVIGRTEKNGQEACKTLGENASFFCVDVKHHESVKGFAREILAKWGKIDILVNNAGISKNSLFLRVTESDWDHVVDTNLKSVYNMTYAFSRNLIKNRGAKVVNISSIAGGVVGGNPGQAPYAASKAAIGSLTKVLAKEFARRGVNVNCVAPGYTETEMVDFLDEENKKKWEEMIPMQRFGMPEEIANAVLFLASDSASYITGHTLVVDGGLTS